MSCSIYLSDLESHATHVAMRSVNFSSCCNKNFLVKMASRLYGAEDVLERLFEDDFGLSDSDDSDQEGEGVHGYLPMGSLGSTIEDELGEVADRGNDREGDGEEDTLMSVDSEDSSEEPASSKSTILETKYKV